MPIARLLILAAAFLLPVLASGTAAHAQQIVALVNGDPVTSYDVSQRQLMHSLIERKPVSAKEALEELIDDRIKIQQASRLKLDVDQKDVDRMYASVAERSDAAPSSSRPASSSPGSMTAPSSGSYLRTTSGASMCAPAPEL